MSYLGEEPTESDLAPAGGGRGRGKTMALGIASLAVVAAGVFAAVNLAGGDDNAPTDPVRAMVEAAERGDAIGILEQLDPGERDAVRHPLEQLTSELNRLGVLKDANLSHLTGYELKVTDLKLTATGVRDGLQTVRVTGGKSTYTVDPTKLPLGSFVRDLAGDALEQGKASGSDNDLSFKADDDDIAVVKRGSRWYVSIGYSVAESARRDRGVAIAAMPDGVPAVGADSPEAAVRDLFQAATKLDVRRLIELTPPDELGALHDYAGLFIADVERDTARMRQSFSVSMPTLELGSDTSGDESLVTVKKVEFEARAAGLTLSYRGGCLDMTIQGAAPRHVCPNTNPADVFKTFGFGALDLPTTPTFSFAGKHAKVGFVTTKVDGKWYVSPTRTILDDLVEVVKLVQPSDLEKGRDWVQQLQETFMSEASKSVTMPSTGTLTVPTPASLPPG